MFIEKIKIHDYKILQDIELNFNKNFIPRLFPIGSQNGGGKSTLLQLIFTLLHCSFDETKDEFIKNLFEDFTIDSEVGIKNIATFNISHENENVELDFFVIETEILNALYDDKYNAYNTYIGYSKDNNLQINELIKEENIINNIIKDLQPFKNQKTINDEIKNKLEEIINPFKNENNKYLFEELLLNSNELFNYFTTQRKEIQDNISMFVGLNKSFSKIIKVAGLITNFRNLYKSTTLSDKLTLIYFTNEIDDSKFPEFSKLLQTKIFLASPLTQIFHFLAKEEKKSYYKFDDFGKTDYYTYLNNAKNKFHNNFYTYDYLIIERLKNLLIELRNNDTDSNIQKGVYENNLGKFLKELNQVINNKSFKPSKDLRQIFFKINNYEKEFSPEDLSHGELKILSIFLWLKVNDISDAIVLFDEIENNLHPDWQFEIARDLTRWSSTNQYIVATHSYEVCNAVTPAHIQELEPKLIKNQN